MTDGAANVVTMICTGNSARSVMARYLLQDRLGSREDIVVESAGTLVLPGHPVSSRTRAALDRHGLVASEHRSAQLDAEIAERSTMLLVMEASHVRWIRRELPEFAHKSLSLARAVRDLPIATGPDLAERVASLDLAAVEFEPWEEVVDPAGGEQPDFDECAAALASLIDALLPSLG